VIVQRGKLLLLKYLLKAETATDARAHAHLHRSSDGRTLSFGRFGGLVREASIATAIPHDGEAT
jgi:hypothetical protein